MNVRSSFILADTVDAFTATFLFEHDHRPRADRAPQITASVTRDKRQAHWHIKWGKLGPDRISAQTVTRAPCACRPEVSLSTGQIHAFVKP